MRWSTSLLFHGFDVEPEGTLTKKARRDSLASEGKPNLRNFKLLLFFMKGDSRIPDAFHWGFSVQAKVNAVGILHEEVLSQIPKCCNELEVAEKAGMGEAIQCLILAIKYEVFLNSIYALCENLSYLVHYLCRKKVPLRFKDQKKEIPSKQRYRFTLLNDPRANRMV